MLALVSTVEKVIFYMVFISMSDLKFMPSSSPTWLPIQCTTVLYHHREGLSDNIKQWLHSIWLLYSSDLKYLPFYGKLDTTIIYKIAYDFIKHSNAAMKVCQNRKTKVR